MEDFKDIASDVILSEARKGEVEWIPSDKVRNLWGVAISRLTGDLSVYLRVVANFVS